MFLTMNLITLEDHNARRRIKVATIGRFRSSFVNIDTLVSGEAEAALLAVFKQNTDANIINSRGNEKYMHDLFYLAPLYAGKFSSVSRLLVLDLDLTFQESVDTLWAEFARFSPGQVDICLRSRPIVMLYCPQCIGLASDLSPHYRHRLARYRRDHPSTEAGQPGPGRQGFNTGVALYDLSCLRASEEYSAALDPGQVAATFAK